MGCITSIPLPKGARRCPATTDENLASLSRCVPEHSTLAPITWPEWLVRAAGDLIGDWPPLSADNFEKLEKIGQETYGNVYKARDKVTGKVMAVKKVRFDASIPASVDLMVKEVRILKMLNHPNVIKLEGLATSTIFSGLYLVFEYVEHDLSASQEVKLTEPQVKCYMQQLLSGLEHCHNNGVLHRDIKSSNLLINDKGILKIADFGLATIFDPVRTRPMTSKVATLSYSAPELLLGTNYYGIGVDLWSAGCILAELLADRQIFPGRTEIEHMHMIFKLCGTPSEECWTKLQANNASLDKTKLKQYNRCILETFKDFPSSSLTLVDTLLSMDPDERGTATAALTSEFFISEPYACQPSSLPKYSPSKEIDLRLRAEKEKRGSNGKAGKAKSIRKVRAENHTSRAIPAPQANAEIQSDLNRLSISTEAQAKGNSEKFRPRNLDGTIGQSSNSSDILFDALGDTITTKSGILRWSVYGKGFRATKL